MKAIDEKLITFTYCKICDIYKPPKTYHCKYVFNIKIETVIIV